MIRRLLLALAVLSLSAAACGDDAATPTATSTTSASPAVAATAAGGSAGNSTPTAAEVKWMTDVCALEVRADTAEDAIPGFGQDTSTLTLQQRRARAEILWPAQADIADAFVADMRAITPPPGGANVHKAITSRSETFSAEVRRSFAEREGIFASAASLEANNDRLRAAERAANGAVDDAFNAAPAVIALYESMPGCTRRPPATE